MTDFIKTKYKIQSLCCDTIFEDHHWELNCPYPHAPSLLRAVYEQKQLKLHSELSGMYQFADWLPISRTLEGSGAPVTYKSLGLAQELGLSNLYITWAQRLKTSI